MNIAELFDRELLDRCLRDRLVVRREQWPLAILNYTERCQYEKGNWNPVTLACRGLIYNVETGDVIARPFRKFFNFGQDGSPDMALSAAVRVTDKMDGSLGILYPVGIPFDGHHQYAIATRGSFESLQATHATLTLWRKYPGYRPPPGVTVLFEIVYPGNRIVLDYGEQDDLVCLGGVEIETGRSIDVPDWPGPHVEVFPYKTLDDALCADPRKNAEGLVIHFLRTDERVKLKQEDYVALHRIVTGLNERTVWEHLSQRKQLKDLLENLPDEFQQWVMEVAGDLFILFNHVVIQVEAAYKNLLGSLPEGWTRKDFALKAKKSPLAGYLFAKLDGKEINQMVWKEIRPESPKAPRTYSEDTA